MKSPSEPLQPRPADTSDEEPGTAEVAPLSLGSARAPHDTASYVADMTNELSKLASGAGLDVLAYLLDMARLEATKSVRRSSQGRIAGR